MVTGSGKTKIKVHDPETRTIGIQDESRSGGNGGDDELEIRLLNATPDLGTFTEIFEVTAHRMIALDESEDFLATRALHNGNENVTRATSGSSERTDRIPSRFTSSNNEMLPCGIPLS